MTNPLPPSTPTPETEPALRHVRLRLPDPLYRALRHRLVDGDPKASVSDVIVELLDVALAGAR